MNGHKETVQKLANAFVKTLRWMSDAHARGDRREDARRLRQGGDRRCTRSPIKATLPMFTTDGVMPADGPETVENVLKAFNPNLQERHGGPVQDLHHGVREEGVH